MARRVAARRSAPQSGPERRQPSVLNAQRSAVCLAAERRADGGGAWRVRGSEDLRQANDPGFGPVRCFAPTRTAISEPRPWHSVAARAILSAEHQEVIVGNGFQRLTYASLVLLAACGASGPQISDVQRPDATTHAKALIVLPVALAMADSTSLEIAMRTGEVMRWVLANTSQPVIGPADFALRHPVDEIGVVSADTDLMEHGSEFGLPVREAAVLHILVTENRATNVRDIQDVRNADPKKQQTFRQHGLEAHLRTEVWLSDAMRGQHLAGLVVETTDDPTDVMPGGDPRPGLTQAIQLALAQLQEIAGPLLAENGARQTRGDGLVDSLPTMLAWAPPGKQSWDETNKSKDELMREAARFAVWDRVAPGLPDALRTIAMKHPGVLVRQAQGGLQPGDVVTAVNGRPVTAAYQVDRALQVGGPVGARAQVLRGGGLLDVTLQGKLVPAPAP